MIEFFKTLIAERIVLKIAGFTFAIFVLPMLIFFYGLDDEPNWIQKKEHHLEYSYAITVKVPLQVFNLQKSKEELVLEAEKVLKKEIYNRAFKQIKLSYDWDNLETSLQDKIHKELQSKIDQLQLDNIKEESIYEDKLDFIIYGLYSIENSNIDVILQKIFERINRKILFIKYSKILLNKTQCCLLYMS